MKIHQDFIECHGNPQGFIGFHENQQGFFMELLGNPQLLMGFYENFGFIEAHEVNTEWKCFGETAFPSMIMKL